jgi:hypothetical protein
MVGLFEVTNRIAGKNGILRQVSGYPTERASHDLPCRPPSVCPAMHPGKRNAVTQDRSAYSLREGLFQ